jgi:hypothetical protein
MEATKRKWDQVVEADDDEAQKTDTLAADKAKDGEFDRRVCT